MSGSWGLYSGVTTGGIAAGARKRARNQPEVEGARLFSTLILIPARPIYKYTRDKLTFTLHCKDVGAFSAGHIIHVSGFLTNGFSSFVPHVVHYLGLIISSFVYFIYLVLI